MFIDRQFSSLFQQSILFSYGNTNVFTFVLHLQTRCIFEIIHTVQWKTYIILTLLLATALTIVPLLNVTSTTLFIVFGLKIRLIETVSGINVTSLSFSAAWLV